MQKSSDPKMRCECIQLGSVLYIELLLRQLDEWSFRPIFCTVMKVGYWNALLWSMPLVQDRSLDLFTRSPARYRSSTDSIGLQLRGNSLMLYFNVQNLPKIHIMSVCKVNRHHVITWCHIEKSMQHERSMYREFVLLLRWWCVEFKFYCFNNDPIKPITQRCRLSFVVKNATSKCFLRTEVLLKRCFKASLFLAMCDSIYICLPITVESKLM